MRADVLIFHSGALLAQLTRQSKYHLVEHLCQGASLGQCQSTRTKRPHIAVRQVERQQLRCTAHLILAQESERKNWGRIRGRRRHDVRLRITPERLSRLRLQVAKRTRNLKSHRCGTTVCLQGDPAASCDM